MTVTLTTPTTVLQFTFWLNILLMLVMMMLMMMMMLQMLISVTSCNVNAADNDQTVPLVMAALQGNAVICETLVRSHAVCLTLLHGVAENQ